VSDPRATARTSLLDRFLKTFGLFLVCVVGLSGCPKLLCDIGLADQCETYTVTYFANGADDGMVPVDDRDYQAGDEVTARSNSGGLVLSGYTFTGWNTAANGDGTTYRSGDTFAMGRADITLFAAWSEHEEEEVTTYTVTYHANGATSGTPPVASSPAAKCLRHHVSPSLCPSIS